MAVDIIALVGHVTKAQTARTLGMDFSGWKLRKDNPGTPGSTVKGKDKRMRGTFVLVCASLVDLERSGQLLAHEGYASRLIVVLERTSRLERANFNVPPSRAGNRNTVEVSDTGFVFTAVSDTCSIDIGQAVLKLVCPGSLLLSAARVAVEEASMTRLAGGSHKIGVGIGAVPLEPDSIPPFDVFLTNTEASTDVALDEAGRGLLRELGVPVVDVDMSSLQPVDTRWISPAGFEAEPRLGVVDLTLEHVKRRILLTSRPRNGGSRVYDVSAGLNENVIADLRPYRQARLQRAGEADPRHMAMLLAGMACAGIPLEIDDLPPAGAWGVGADLRGQYSVLPDLDLEDDLTRQAWSVDTRRQALRVHSQQEILRGIVPRRSSERCGTDDSISVVIPSRRPEFVESIVRQAVHQSHTNREVLVGLHGYSRQQLLAASPWLQSRTDVRFIEVDAELNLGEALNKLTVEAGGDYIAKMDDDDLYTEHHLADLLAAARYSGAELVGCKAEFVYLEVSGKTIQRRPNSEMYDATVTGGTMLLSRETLRKVGGWSPVGTAEDRLLHESLRKLGGTVYRTHGMNYLMRRGDGERMHTWNPDSALFEKQAIRSWDGLGYPGWRTSGDD